MNILHVIASLAQETGGPAKAVLEMAEAVAGRGHTLTVFSTDFGWTDCAKPALRFACSRWRRRASGNAHPNWRRR